MGSSLQAKAKYISIRSTLLPAVSDLFMSTSDLQNKSNFHDTGILIIWESMGCIRLPHDRGQLWTFVITVTNLRVPEEVGDLLNG
jgi:hypothetical protein